MRTSQAARVLGVVAVWLTAAAGRAWGQQPSATLLVVAAGPEAEAGAARVFRVAHQNMRQTRSLVYVDADDVLGRGLKGESPDSVAEDLYRQGRQAYDNLELKQAAELLKRAARDLDAHLDERMDRELFTDIYTYWGSALVLDGRKKPGERIYRKLLVLNPQARLDPVVFPPSLTATFNRIAGEAQRSGTGTLRVTAATPGAEVWVDGVFRGISPVLLEQLVEGEHMVRLVRRGYRSWGRRQSVLEGSQEVIRQGLEPLPGFERLEGYGARIASAARTAHYPGLVDEILGWVGVDRLVFILVEAGAESLFVRAYYYDRQSRTCLKARKKVFNPSDPSFDEMVNLFCTALYMNVGGQVIAGTGKSTGAGAGIPVRREEGDEPGSIGSSWWLWTAIGVAVAGGAGLALYFILGAEEGPGEGEVIFRF